MVLAMVKSLMSMESGKISRIRYLVNIWWWMAGNIDDNYDEILCSLDSNFTYPGTFPTLYETHGGDDVAVFATGFCLLFLNAKCIENLNHVLLFGSRRLYVTFVHRSLWTECYSTFCELCQLSGRWTDGMPLISSTIISSYLFGRAAALIILPK